MRVLRIIWDWLRGIITGDILGKFKIGHYLPQITCIVAAITLYIVIGIIIDTKLATVEENKKRIEEMTIELALKTKTYSSQFKLETIEGTLERNGIDIHIPKKPAVRIEE